MFKVFFAVFLGLIAAAPALAQPAAIEIAADPAPIIEVTLNGQTARLLVEPGLPDMLVFNTAAAERFHLQAIPLVNARVIVDGAGLNGRIARPVLRFANGRSKRINALIFGIPVSDAADGAIGPGALPYDVVTFRLGADAPGERAIAFNLRDPDNWNAPARVSPDRELDLGFMLGSRFSILNRPAAGLLDSDHLLTPAGELETRPFLLGLSTRMQPVTLDASLNVQGLGLGPVLARTASPIIGADNDDAMFVVAESDAAPTPRLALGRDAMRACSTLSVDRRAKRLTLRCAS